MSNTVRCTDWIEKKVFDVGIQDRASFNDIYAVEIWGEKFEVKMSYDKVDDNSDTSESGGTNESK